MASALARLRAALPRLDTELGETFALASEGVSFTARREDRERVLPDYGGTTRESALHVQRAALPATLPAAGAIISLPGGGSARLARLEPGKFSGLLTLVLADELL